MKRNFRNINEEIERIKTLMFETDNFIKNGTPLNESVETTEVDEQETETNQDFKGFGGAVKVEKVSDVNQFYRMFTKGYEYEKSQPVYKAKATGDFKLLDGTTLSSAGKSAIEAALVKNKIPYNKDTQEISIIKQKDKMFKDKVFFQILDTAKKSQNVTDLERNVTPSGQGGATSSDALKSQTDTTKDSKTVPDSGQKTDATQKGRFEKPDKSKFKEYVGKDYAEVTKKFDPYRLRELSQDTLEKDKEFAKKLQVLDKDGKIDRSRVGMQDEFYTYYGEDGSAPEFIFHVTPDNKIKNIRTAISGGVMKESFNMSLLYTNPLLFESVISEQETSSNGFDCIGDCGDIKPFTPAPADTTGGEKKTGAETKFNPKGLKFGDNSEDVRELQQKLIDAGFLDPKRIKGGKPTTYFGNLTQAALDKALGKTTTTSTPTTTKTGSTNKSDTDQQQTQQQTQQQPSSSFDVEATIEKLRSAIWDNPFNEDESAIYSVFQHEINSAENLNKLVAAWKAKNFNPNTGTVAKKGEKWSKNSLADVLKEYLNDNELEIIRGHIKKYANWSGL